MKENEVFNPNSVQEYDFEICGMSNMDELDKQECYERNLSYGIQDDYFERITIKVV